MSAFPINKLLTSGVGVLVIATAIAWGEAAGASNFQPSSIGKISYSGSSFLAQFTQPSSDISPDLNTQDILPTSDSPSPSPARVPEPATLAGLGLVAGSFALTRRRQSKKEL